jgi:hypothetical protein
MATAAVQHQPSYTSDQLVEPLKSKDKESRHDVTTTLNYYREPADGSPPEPTYIGYALTCASLSEIMSDVHCSKPTTYQRPSVSQNVVITDISGNESKYTLDSHGFQIYNHESNEKEFIDDDKIKAEYYPETEQLLKDA